MIHIKFMIKWMISQMLEENPNNFYHWLQIAKYRNIDVSENINSTTKYETYNSTLAHCVIYLTGTLEKEPDIESVGYFYGKESRLDPMLGIIIFKLLVELGADLNIQNYYGESVYDFRNYDNFSGTLTHRKGNEELILLINKYYNEK